MIWEDLKCQARWFAIDICLSAHIFLERWRYVVLVGCQFWQEGVGTWQTLTDPKQKSVSSITYIM